MIPEQKLHRTVSIRGFLMTLIAGCIARRNMTAFWIKYRLLCSTAKASFPSGVVDAIGWCFTLHQRHRSRQEWSQELHVLAHCLRAAWQVHNEGFATDARYSAGEHRKYGVFADTLPCA